ncbi:unnamed protein product [Schistocephalus solidus]|uniref:Reverse transcriptase domain-containing protein n=1 Tax=Schistocephalus solidus TaxID=70667 RepID=A0A183TSQ2_SCHSO|nr:unnamed protein product [Schistocephalus solidus]
MLYLYKKKWNCQLCYNHWGISLLNIVGNNFTHILLNRLNDHQEQGILPETQCSFRRNRVNIDMTFAAHQLQEKCQVIQTHLYASILDLTKAFDTMIREELGKSSQKFGCPE